MPQTGFKLTVRLGITLNFWSSFVHIPSALGAYHDTWVTQCCRSNLHACKAGPLPMETQQPIPFLLLNSVGSKSLRTGVSQVSRSSFPSLWNSITNSTFSAFRVSGFCIPRNFPLYLCYAPFCVAADHGNLLLGVHIGRHTQCPAPLSTLSPKDSLSTREESSLVSG